MMDQMEHKNNWATWCYIRTTLRYIHLQSSPETILVLLMGRLLGATPNFTIVKFIVTSCIVFGMKQSTTNWSQLEVHRGPIFHIWKMFSWFQMPFKQCIAIDATKTYMIVIEDVSLNAGPWAKKFMAEVWIYGENGDLGEFSAKIRSGVRRADVWLRPNTANPANAVMSHFASSDRGTCRSVSSRS